MDAPAALLPSRISNLTLDQPPAQAPRIQSKFDPKAASAQALAAGLLPKPQSGPSSRPSPSRPAHPTGGGGGRSSALLKMAMGGAAASASERYSHYGGGQGGGGGGHNNNATLQAGPSSSQHHHHNQQQQQHARPQSSSFHHNNNPSAHNPSHAHTAQGLHGPAHATHLRVAASSLGGAQARAAAGTAAYDKVIFGKYDGGFEADERERNGGMNGRDGGGEEGGVMLGKVKELELSSGGPDEGGMGTR